MFDTVHLVLYIPQIEYMGHALQPNSSIDSGALIVDILHRKEICKL